MKEKAELEEEVNKLKSTMAHQKLKFEEDTATLRTQLKLEESTMCRKYEERIGVMAATRDDLQANIGRMVAQEAETHTKLVSYQKEADNFKQVCQI